MKFTALELILHLADGSTTPNTPQHIAKIARETLDALKEQEALQPYKDMTNADYLRGHREGRKLAQPEQEPVAWHNKIVGMEVSMDVSTGEDDAHHRVFGRVYGVMLEASGATNDTILAIEASRNFTTPPAQPEQEPVATVTSETGNPDVTMSWWHEPALPVGTKLYTTPPKRTWVGLTDEDLEFWTKELGQGELGRGVLRAVADHLKEKNT